MALTSGQRRKYLDRLTAYRGGTRDARGNATGVRLVESIDQVPCRLHETLQFQSKQAPAIRINQDNLETADSVAYELVHELRENDIIRVDRRQGEIVWYSLAGNPRKVPEGNFAQVFLQRTPPPVIAP